MIWDIDSEKNTLHILWNWEDLCNVSGTENMICDIDLEKHALLILWNWEDWCNVSGIINMISKLNLEKVWTKFRQNWAMGTTLWTHKAQKGGHGQ